MSELLENLIDDRGFYYIDCIASKKGIWFDGIYSSNDKRLK
jgi:hypothetical protein